MFGHNYSHSTIRRYVSLFGTLFNDIFIDRIDKDNNVQTIKVPLTYGPKEKVLARLNADPTLDRPYGIILPYITFQMGAIKYAPERKMNTIQRNCYPSANSNFSTYVYNPVPYDINFELTVIVKNIEDGNKIIEQILPFFTPMWTTTIRIIDDPAIVRDVPVILNDVNSADSYDGQFENRRYITWTLTFTMKADFFGPIPQSKIIKKSIGRIAFSSNTQMSIDTNANNRFDEIITTTPGLTANGQPTSDPDQTIPYSDINWDDDYGYIVTVETAPYANT